MSNTEQSSNGGDTPTATAHATQRWSERMPDAVVDVESAWMKGIHINAPNCDCEGAKLYPPEDALLLQKSDQIVTVLSADYTRLDTTNLLWCSTCGCATTLLRSWTECEWCGAPISTNRSDGNIHLIADQ